MAFYNTALADRMASRIANAIAKIEFYAGPAGWPQLLAYDDATGDLKFYPLLASPPTLLATLNLNLDNTLTCFDQQAPGEYVLKPEYLTVTPTLSGLATYAAIYAQAPGLLWETSVAMCLTVGSDTGSGMINFAAGPNLVAGLPAVLTGLTIKIPAGG